MKLYGVDPRECFTDGFERKGSALVCAEVKHLCVPGDGVYDLERIPYTPRG